MPLNSRKHKARNRVLCEELEPRILFSADGLTPSFAASEPAAHQEHALVLTNSELARLGLSHSSKPVSQELEPSLFASNDHASKLESAFSAATAAAKVTPPVFESAGPFSIVEGSKVTAVVGDVDANNGDGGAVDVGINYSILTNANPDGDGDDAFVIDAATGILSVNDSSDLDFESFSSHTLVVQASDGEFTSNTSITVNVVDVLPVVSAVGAGAINAGVPYNLDLVVTEPGTNSISDYVVNWGDGTVTTVPYNGTTTSLTHTYANIGITYDITFSIIESSGQLTSTNLIVGNYTVGNDDVFSFNAESGSSQGMFQSSGGQLQQPYGLTVGPDGHFYVAGYQSDNIVRYSAEGDYLGVFTADAQLNAPTSVTWGSDGNLYVANSLGNNILRFAPDGEFMGVWASGGSLDQPEDIAFGPDGDLYVASWNNRSIVVIDGENGGAATTLLNAGDGLSNPEQITFGPEGDLFIANAGAAQVLRWDGSSVSVYFTHAELTFATGVAFGPDGDLYVSSFDNDKILRYNGATGTVVIDDGAGGLEDPAFLAFTPAHQVMVVDNAAPNATNLNSTSSYFEGDAAVAIDNIVVNDTDSPETITATLTLGNTTVGALSANDGASYSADTGIWTITDGRVKVNTALANLVFLPTLNNDLDASISVDIDDGDEDASGSLTGAIQLEVTPINDAPSGTNLSVSETYDEDTDKNLIDIVVSDVDDVSTAVTLTLSDVTAGSLSTSTSATVTSSYNASTGVWSAAGAITDVNALLASVTFSPSLNYNSDFSIATSISDGSGAPVLGEKNILGIAANDPPTATNTNVGESYTEDTPLNLVDIVVTDVDHSTTTVSLALSDTGAGSLSIATSGSVISSYDAITGVWNASGNIADVNSLLTGVTFTPALNYDSDFSITTAIADGASSIVLDTKLVTARAVNDSPTATNLGANEAYIEDTPFKLTDIIVSDVDSVNVDAKLALSDAGAGRLSTGTSGAVSSVFDPDTGIWSASGAQADVNALLANVVFTPTLNYSSSFQIFTSVGDGSSAPATGTKNVFTTADNDNWYLWLTTLGSASPSGAPGLDEWNDSTFLALRGPNFTLGENVSDGTLSSVFDLSRIAGTDSQVDAVHHVANDLTLGGTGFPAIEVRAGDVIFSTAFSETLVSANSIDVNDEDVVLFSPTDPGDYSSGTFTILFESPISGDVDAVTLVERDTALADGTVLEQGDFLFTSDKEDGKLFWFVTEDLGAGNTVGEVRVLLDGADAAVNLSSGIRGVDLVENGTSMGGVDLVSGQLLISTSDTISGGSNNQAFTHNDIVVLTVTQSTWSAGSGNGAASIAVLLDGGGVGLDTTAERIQGISLVSTNTGGGNSAPLATNLNAAENYIEDTPLDITNIVVSDIDHATTTVTLTLSDTAAGSLSVGTSGAVTATYNATNGVWAAAGDIADVNNLLANMTFTPSAHYTGDFTIDTMVSDGVAAPVFGSKSVMGAAVNDAPTVINLNTFETFVEDTPLDIANIVVSDLDGTNTTVNLRLLDVAAGVLSTATFGTVTSGFDEVSGVWSASGTIGDVNALLANVVFTPSLNYADDFEMAISVDDGVAAPVTGVAAFTAMPVNDDPLAIAGGPYGLLEGGNLILNASDSLDIDGNIVAYEWLIGATPISLASTANPTLDWAALSDAGVNDDGVFDVTLRVTDGQGGMDTDNFQITVSNVAPVVAVSGADQLILGDTYTVNLAAIDPGLDTIMSWTIDWGDGTIDTLLGNPGQAEHTYTSASSHYTVSVMASDEDGSYMANSLSLAVIANEPPLLVLTSTSLTIDEDTDLSERLFLADIMVNDDDLGVNKLTLFGEHANLFEIDGTALYLRAGVALDFDSDQPFEVEVQVDDASVGETPDDSVVFTLSLDTTPGSNVFAWFEALTESAVGPGLNQAEPIASNQEPDASAEPGDEASSAQSDNADDTPSGLERGVLPGATRGNETLLNQVSDATIDDTAIDAILKNVVANQLLSGQTMVGLASQATQYLNEQQQVVLDFIQDQPLDAFALSAALESVDIMEGYSLTDNDRFLQGLDEVRRELGDIDLDKKMVIGSSTIVSSSLSIGYILWLLRGGVLLSAMLSSLPAWRVIDPLPILHGALESNQADDDDESLQSMIESSEEKPANPTEDNVENERS